MTVITEESTIAELMNALADFAVKRGWEYVQVSLGPDGLCSLMEPEYATRADEEFDVGDPVGFTEDAGFDCIGGLGEALAEGDAE